MIPYLGACGHRCICACILQVAIPCTFQRPCNPESPERICGCIPDDVDAVTLPVPILGEVTIEFRYRGLVEPAEYIGGTNDGAWFQIGGAHNGEPENSYWFTVTDGSGSNHVFFLNRLHAGVSLGTVYPIDYTKSLTFNGIRRLRLDADSMDNIEASNPCLIIPGLGSFDGQFVQSEFSCDLIFPIP